MTSSRENSATGRAIIPESIVKEARRRYAAGQTQEEVYRWMIAQGQVASYQTVRRMLRWDTYKSVCPQMRMGGNAE